MLGDVLVAIVFFIAYCVFSYLFLRIDVLEEKIDLLLEKAKNDKELDQK